MPLRADLHQWQRRKASSFGLSEVQVDLSFSCHSSNLLLTFPSLPLSLLFSLFSSFLYLGISQNKPFASRSVIQALPLWEQNSSKGPVEISEQ